MKKIISITFLTLLTLALMLPILIYEIGLYNINNLPTPPSKSQLIGIKSLDIQKYLKIKESINQIKLNPYSYTFAIFNTENAIQLNQDAIFASIIAKNHNQYNLKDKRNLYWHLSGAALTIWITRHWTVEQILTKVYEIKLKSKKF